MATRQSGSTTTGQAEVHSLTSAQRTTLLRLARATIAHYLATGETLVPDSADPALTRPAGAFVTLRRRRDRLPPDWDDRPGARLRGCIGRIQPDRPLIHTVTQAAVSAAAHDYRFLPVTPAELPDLTVEISVLSPIRPIADINDLVIGRDGLLVDHNGRRAMLLPQVAVERGWRPADLLAQTCAKAGLPIDAPARLYTFTVEHFEEGG